MGVVITQVEGVGRHRWGREWGWGPKRRGFLLTKLLFTWASPRSLEEAR